MENIERIKRDIKTCKEKIALWDKRANSFVRSERIGLSSSARQDIVDSILRLELLLKEKKKSN